MRFIGASVNMRDNGSNEPKARYSPNSIHLCISNTHSGAMYYFHKVSIPIISLCYSVTAYSTG